MKELDLVIARLEEQSAALSRALEALRQISDSGATNSSSQAQPDTTAARKGGMTPEGRKRLVAALKKRWAQKRAAQADAERAQKNAAAAKKRQATLVRKRISEAMKERWAAKKKQEASQQRAAKRAQTAKKNAAATKRAASRNTASEQQSAPAES